LGSKAVVYYKDLWIEADDAAAVEVGEKVTLMKWGNCTITKKEENELHGTLDLDDKDFKKTKKFTWVAADEGTTIEVLLLEFDHLINKKKLEDKEEVKDFVNMDSRVEYSAIGEGHLRNL